MSTDEAAAEGKHAEAAKTKKDKETILVDCLEITPWNDLIRSMARKGLLVRR